ncbi:DUF924 domain-containing protein [Paracoccaceae bacterium]|nr:DUF924 domain-containing protein [Paracoccaceae bacterium]
MEKKITSVLNFWFKSCEPKDWFKKNEYFDREVKNNFGDLVEDALFGYLNSWHRTLDGCMAFIVLTDQFTRNILRGTPRSFSGDKLALKTRLHFLGTFDIRQQNRACSHFILIPLMHSENLTIQKRSLPLFQNNTSAEVYKYALQHKKIIARFGRFPHRNAILGRTSTETEIQFLKGPGSSF